MVGGEHSEMRMRRSNLVLAVALVACAPAADDEHATDDPVGETDTNAQPSAAELAKIELGRLLFFDKVISGNMDTACATCHHPDLATGDAISLSAGPGSEGLGEDRVPRPDVDREARNSPPLFALAAFDAMFWDGRTEAAADGRFPTGHGGWLPDGLDGPVAAQAMFPPQIPIEMKGQAGDLDVHGNANEIALLDEEKPEPIWAAYTDRVLALPEYTALLDEAYPERDPTSWSFVDLANAIAAFELEALPTSGSPWDRYRAGETGALSDTQARGHDLFFGKAACGECHVGDDLTDAEYHNTVVPQLGPGKDEENDGRDLGRARVSGLDDDRFRFRTPSLRNVALTGPWMHDGAYTSLDGAVRHMLDPVAAFDAYDVNQVSEELRPELFSDPVLNQEMKDRVSPIFAPTSWPSWTRSPILLRPLHPPT